MDLHALLTRAPIDQAARRVTSQAGVTDIDAPLSGGDIAPLLSRLRRKQRLLKMVLNIKTRRQHKNVTSKARHGIRQYRAGKEPRALAEYMLCGREIKRLEAELAEMRRARRYVADTQRAARDSVAQHPGAVA